MLITSGSQTDWHLAKITMRLEIGMLLILEFIFRQVRLSVISSYVQVTKPESTKKTAEKHYATTKARIEKIQSQLHNATRREKYKGKVCIITGVGSLKGIEYASLLL